MSAEGHLIKLIATDRIEIPISSASGRLKRQKKPIALEAANEFNIRYTGDRTYARVEETDKLKARTMTEGVEVFGQRHPKYGKILNDIIAEERTKKETHLYFGMQEGCRITADDYREVMTNLGFTPAMAEQLYPALMDVSRKISKKREEERSIMIG
jgi:hypothetical protein